MTPAAPSHTLKSIGELFSATWARFAGRGRQLLILVIISDGLHIVNEFFADDISAALKSNVTPESLIPLLMVVIGAALVGGVLAIVATIGQTYVLGIDPAPSTGVALQQGIVRFWPVAWRSAAIFTIFLVGMAIAGIAAVGSIAGIINHQAEPHWGKVALSALFGTVALTACCFTVWLSVRMTFVHTLTALREADHPFVASWRLTRGYSWPLLWRLIVIRIVLVPGIVISMFWGLSVFFVPLLTLILAAYSIALLRDVQHATVIGATRGN